MIGHVAATLAGLLGLAGTWLAWTGRWRTAGRSVIAPNWAWTALPSTALIVLGYGMQPLAGDAVYYVAFPVAVVSFVMLFWDPDWYGPRWWRERDETEMDLRAPDNAYLHAAAAGAPGMPIGGIAGPEPRAPETAWEPSRARSIAWWPRRSARSRSSRAASRRLRAAVSRSAAAWPASLAACRSACASTDGTPPMLDIAIRWLAASAWVAATCYAAWASAMSASA